MLSKEFSRLEESLRLDSSARYKALKRVSSAGRKAMAGLICQVQSSQQSFLGTKKG
jgi:hypothetical protein